MPQGIPDHAALRRHLLRDADLCVKCGLCLGHCPTYRITRDEAESPRGRITLMQGLAGGALAASPKLEAHLDRCLSCRACEVVCPANVPYGALIDGARELLAHERPQRTRLTRAMAAVLESPALSRGVAAALMFYQRSGLQWLVRATGLLKPFGLARLESVLPHIHWPSLPRGSLATSSPAGAHENRVALFANCTSPLTAPASLDAAITVLNALGCEVSVPRAQGCCGALAQHGGLHADAQACASRNVEAFAGEATVLGTASGCTAQLLEYGALLAGDGATRPGDGAAFGAKVRDVHAYICAHPNYGSLSFAPLSMRVMLQTPCTMKNVVRADASVVTLLERIPGLEILRLDSGCCGAAGSYFISQPAMADALAKIKVDQVAQAAPAVLLSSNVGCSMHLAAALRRDGIKVAVKHPLELVAASLGSGSRPASAAAVRPARPA